MVLLLLEAVEASRCRFFENWLMKHKFFYLLKPLGTIIQKNYWSSYPSELIYFIYFTMRHPVLGKKRDNQVRDLMTSFHYQKDDITIHFWYLHLRQMS